MNRTQDYRPDIDERVNKARKDRTHEGVWMLFVLCMIMGGYYFALDSIF